MSKTHNYSRMYNKNESAVVENDIPEVPEVDETTVDIPEVPEVEDTPVTPEETQAFGIVVGCDKLNVRMKPNKNGAILYVVDANAKLNIDIDKSTEEWYCVRNAAGIEGFCMKKFVAPKK